MSNSSSSTQGLSNANDNLGLSWEIGVIIGLVFIFLAITAAAIFQCRRRRRSALSLAEDLEKIQRRRHSNAPPSTRRPSSSSYTTLKEPKAFTSPMEGTADSIESTIRKPPPSASSVLSSKRNSQIEYYPEHPSQKPPHYYWDHRP